MAAKVSLNVKTYTVLFLQGFAIGIANAIPGVSGGTIAFIFGIYEDLIASIKTFDVQALRLLCTFRFRDFFSHVAWQFLGTVVVGAFFSILIFAKLISWCMETHPVLINAYFWGLIAASIPIMIRAVRSWNIAAFLMCFLFTGITFWVGRLIPIVTPDAAWFIFLCGALAISAMILPGISGSFILLVLGKYFYILNAVNERNFAVLAVFLSGILIGILGFVRVLNWLFEKAHNLTMAALAGIVIGSLDKLWPWKNAISTVLLKGKIVPIEYQNFFPDMFLGYNVLAVGLAVLGIICALVLNRSEKTQ